ncbi:helix-turn-helix transcriptional regulator [Frankia sp. Cr1]|uniref:helix-turn-helix domain-containing protein n=1 Tax=Frankia sp. Cr1 TaxID=3073931 RepID=UPI002AD3923A|nr:helix-turn-helix transcriptional regulator [Frankia sp. Cr1]
MASDTSPTMRRRQVGAELRRLREAADVTIDEAAAHLGCSGSKISRMETGVGVQRARDVTKLLDHYDVTSQDLRAELLGIVRDSRQQDWWHNYTDAVPRWFERFMAAESGAVSVDEFETQAVPGLLQTPGYARAVLRAANTSLDDDEIDRRVTVRMERQKRLDSQDPLALWAVLDESVLRRHIGGADIMRAQLEHLADRATWSNITVQVLPYTLGAYAAFGHPFTILTFPTPTGGEVVHMDQLHSGLYLERESDLRRYKLAMNRLRAAALDPERSRTMISNAAEDLR